MNIKNYQTASQKLRWANSAFQLWVGDNQFLLELKFALDDECRFLIPILKASEIKTEDSIIDDILHVIYKDQDENNRKVAIHYSKIEELVEEIEQVVADDLYKRMN